MLKKIPNLLLKKPNLSRGCTRCTRNEIPSNAQIQNPQSVYFSKLLQLFQIHKENPEKWAILKNLIFKSWPLSVEFTEESGNTYSEFKIKTKTKCAKKNSASAYKKANEIQIVLIKSSYGAVGS